MLQQVKVFLAKLLKASEKGEPVEMSDACKLLGYDISVELGYGYNLKLQTSEEN